MLDFLRRAQGPDTDGKVTILIPSMFDSQQVLELCLKSIWKNTDYPDYDIIVCDAGVDAKTRTFLETESAKGTLRLIKATDWERPKDDLTRAVTAKYYVIMHDDIYIKQSNWLKRRMQLMLKNPRNAVVGTLVPNHYTGEKRFFPLGLLVRTAAAVEIGLIWGKQVEKGSDTGAIAYRQFMAQTKYKMAKYPMKHDIHHWGNMTWPKYKDPEAEFTRKLLQERDEKLARIATLLRTNAY